MSAAARRIRSKEPYRPAPRLYARWMKIHSHPPGVLHHYTTADGLMGILKSGRLWATNSRYLNDPTELLYGVRLIRSVITEELATRPARRLGPYAEWIRFMLDEYEQNAKVYLCCLCENGDLLSQWRGYGAYGGGYAIAFRSKYMGARDLGDAPDPYLILRKVVYDARVQRAFIVRWLNVLAAAVASAEADRGHPAARARMNDAQWRFTSFLQDAFNCFKHPSFSEETEWRLIKFGRDTNRRDTCVTMFRSGGGRIIPYTELTLQQRAGRYRTHLPIRGIRFGPTLHPDLTGRALRALCQAHGYVDTRVTIERSQIPFAG